MTFEDAIRSVRTGAYLSQESFAKEIGVSIATIHRWESGRAKPNITAMKKIRDFCLKNDITFDDVETEWKSKS